MPTTMREVLRRQRAARKLMRDPANQEALRKGLERLKKYVHLKPVAGPKKVRIAEQETRVPERAARKAKAPRRAR